MLLGQRRQRQRIGTEIILAVAIADGQRRAHSRADDLVGIILEQEGDGEGAVQARQDGRNRIRRRSAALDFARDQVRDHFAVGFADRNVRPSAISSSRSGLKFSMMPLWTSATGPAMCGWALSTVGAPCVAQRVWAMPTSPCSRLGGQLARKIVELAFGAAALELAILHGADSGAVIAAIFEPLQPVEQSRARPLRARRSRQCRTYYFLSFFACCRARKRAAQPANPFCSPRAMTSSSAATFFVTTEPAPTIAPAPMLTGATSALFDPMKAPAPISVRYLPKPS